MGVYVQLWTTTDNNFYIRSLSVDGWGDWKHFA